METVLEKIKPQNASTATQAVTTETSDVPKFSEIKSIDLHDEHTFKQFLNTIRLEPFLRDLPQDRSDNPALYEKLRTLIQDMIHDGSLTLYQSGVNIHEQKKYQMQIVMEGTLQLTHNRYSRQIEGIGDVALEGPKFERGMALASWSMAGNTKSHFAEITTVGPVVTFAMSGSQYAELLRLTMTEPALASIGTKIPTELVKVLTDSGAAKAYSEKDSDILQIERQRDFSKRKEVSEQLSQIWKEYKLSDSDFLFKVNGEWHICQHSIQSGIKDATVTQHVLQKNFIYSKEEIAKTPEGKVSPLLRTELTNDEFLALARNTKKLPGSEINVRMDTDEIYLAVFKAKDAENPDRPLKSPDITIPGQMLVKLEGRGNAKMEVTLPIPEHGVIDPKKIFNELRRLHSAELPGIRLMDIKIQVPADVELYAQNIADYRKEVGSSSNYNVERILGDLENLNYQLSATDKIKFAQLLHQTEVQVESQQSIDSRLSLGGRREILSLMYSWLERDLADRRGPDSVIFGEQKFKELQVLMDGLVEYYGDKGSVDRHLKDALTTGSEDKVKLKLALILAQHFNYSTVAGLGKDTIGKIYYKDVKHVFGVGADEAIQRLKPNGYEIQHEYAADVSWARHKQGDTIFIPDRHEDFWGMMHELKAIGVIGHDNKIHIDKLAGKSLIFLGDVLNRNVGTLGCGTLGLVNSLMEEADKWNAANREPGKAVEVKMCLGNHELDLMRQTESQLKESFPEFASYQIAKHCREQIKDMVVNKRIVAGIFLGDESEPLSTEKHAIVTHAGILPEFKSHIFNKLQELNRPVNDLEMVKYFNEILLEAVTRGDFSNPLFSKSLLRGGQNEFSGAIEADMSSSAKSDLTAAIKKLPAGADAAFGYQIVGHSFTSDSPDSRVFQSEAVKIPGCLITDCGDHQVFEADPTVRIRSTIVKADAGNETAKAYTFTARFTTPDQIPTTEEEIYRIHKDAAHPYRTVLKERNSKLNTETYL